MSRAKPHPLLLAVLAFLGPALSARAPSSPGLEIHEWGTFTSFQDADGRTIGGINVDDEPLPAFVHRLRDGLVLQQDPALWQKGAPRCKPEVTLRLETPVVYFHPVAGRAPDAPFSFSASFRGGWITEYYPQATNESPGFPETLAAHTEGRVTWSTLALNPSASVPQATEHVWLAPRKVDAAIVSNGAGEAERYLFYRGVGHVDAPLVVTLHGDKATVRPREVRTSGSLPQLWLVHVAPDGRVAFAESHDRSRGERVLDVPSVAADRDEDHLDELRAALRTALEDAGLFADEAEAMLSTWQRSYFRSPGLRLFLLLPRPWIDGRLPITVSAPASVTRVMVGRIELVSPEQQAALDAIAHTSESELQRLPLYVEALAAKVGEGDPTAFNQHFDALAIRVARHELDLEGAYRALGVEVPRVVAAYTRLGRFRDALLAHLAQQGATETLRRNSAAVERQFGLCLANGG